MVFRPERTPRPAATMNTVPDPFLPEFPLIFRVSRPVEDGVLFLSGSSRITVRNHTSIIWDLVEFADGQLSLSDLVAHLVSLQHDETSVLAVIRDLVELEIIIDSRSLYKEFHAETNNPMRFNSYLKIPEIIALERQASLPFPDGPKLELPRLDKANPSRRFSCRAFGKVPLRRAEYGRLLDSANEQTPSAGNLRPLSYSLIINEDSEDLRAGIYAYNPSGHELIEIAPMASHDPEVLYSLNDEQALYNSAGAIVIAADLARTSTKYANRGYRYALIEAGMAVERILSTCRELGLAALVYGGFNDEALRGLISADRLGAIPLICVAVGKASELPNTEAEMITDLYARLEPYVGPGAPVRWASLVTHRKRGDLSFHQSLSAFGTTSHDSGSNADDRLCGGTAASSLLARTKSIVEALERYSSGAVRADVVGPQEVINPVYVHSDFAPYTVDQIASQEGRLSDFDSATHIEWVHGKSLKTGDDFYVPVDVVFYPLSARKLGRPLISYANSSGVAAQATVEGARKNALLELFERHTILRAWYENEPPASVDDGLWPHFIRRRARYWAAEGYELKMVEFRSTFAQTIGVTLTSSSRFPFFCFGSAAAFGSPTAAMVKAFHEAEVALAGYRREAQPEAILAASDVRTPLNHGLYWAQQPSEELDEFFAAGTLTTEFAGLGTLEELIEAWDPIEIDLDPAGEMPVKIVRVLSPKAVPINFGYGLEHWTHSEVGEQRRSPNTPHFIA